MGFLSNLLGRSDDYEYETEDDGSEGLPELFNGMVLGVESAEGEELFNGRITGYADGDSVVTLERLPRGLSFRVLDLDSTVLLRGCDEEMQPFILKGIVQESTRLVCRFKDVKLKPIDETRESFRLPIRTSAELFYMTDDSRSTSSSAWMYSDSRQAPPALISTRMQSSGLLRLSSVI